MQALGVTAREIDIRPSARADARATSSTRTPTARSTTTSPSRTSRRASAPRTCSGSPTTTAALVIGTGDLSELALGWATYGVGDQMSHYAVNASVPKSLIGFMLRWAIDTRQFDDDVNAVLQSVLDTEISPELIPARRRQADRRQREQGRPVRAAGLLPLLHPALRLPAEQGRVPGRARLGRRRARPVVGPDPARPPQRVLARRDQALARRLPVPLLPDQPVQAHGDPERARRSAPAARSRRAATGARRATRRPTVWLDELRRNVPDLARAASTSSVSSRPLGGLAA